MFRNLCVYVCERERWLEEKDKLMLFVRREKTREKMIDLRKMSW